MEEGGVRAVLFGLHGTLIPHEVAAEHDAVARAMGADLGVDPVAFATAVTETADDRVRGLMADVQHTVRYLARRVGGAPTESQVESALRRCLDYSLSMHAATGALPVLRALRGRGFRLGVVADCSTATAEIWPQSPLAEFFEGVSFSCRTGVRKPDSGAYLVSAAALKVSTSDCVYVGDGRRGDVTGADACGMRGVLLGSGPAAGEGDPDWSGPAIEQLDELVPMLGVPAQRTESTSRTFVSGNVVPWGSQRPVR